MQVDSTNACLRVPVPVIAPKYRVPGHSIPGPAVRVVAATRTRQKQEVACSAQSPRRHHFCRRGVSLKPIQNSTVTKAMLGVLVNAISVGLSMGI